MPRVVRPVGRRVSPLRAERYTASGGPPGTLARSNRDSPGAVGAGVLRCDAHSRRAGNGTESPKRLIMGAPHGRWSASSRASLRSWASCSAAGRRPADSFSPAFRRIGRRGAGRRPPSEPRCLPGRAPRKSLIACRFFGIGVILIDRDLASCAPACRRDSESCSVQAGVKEPVRAGVGSIKAGSSPGMDSGLVAKVNRPAGDRPLSLSIGFENDETKPRLCGL